MLRRTLLDVLSITYGCVIHPHSRSKSLKTLKWRLFKLPLSSTLSLKRHSRVPPSSVGVTDKKFLSGPVLERTTQKASCSTTVAVQRRSYPRRSVLVCGTKPRIGVAVCHTGEDQQRTA